MVLSGTNDGPIVSCETMVSVPSVLNCSIAVAPLAAAVIGPTDRYDIPIDM
jgi:hypothetical protein